MAEGGTWSQRLERAWLERSLLAGSLLPVAALLGACGAVRRWLFRVGVFRTTRLPVPVIVVGNLIAGGAGKTPTVLAAVAVLRRHGLKPGIVSRGYGRRNDDLVDVLPHTPATHCGDEPLLLRLRSGVPVSVGRDRVAAGQQLLRLHPQVNVVVADDGLQHLRLARDVQVIVFDERGIGNGWLLPAGPLREPWPARVPPRSLVVYNAAAPSTAWPGFLTQRRLAGCVALSDWWQGRPASLLQLEALRGRPLVAAAGVARPQRFFDMLRSQGLEIVPLLLPDHFDFGALPWPQGTPDAIVTEKDAVKIDPACIGPTRVWVAALDFAIDPGFETALIRALGLAATLPE